MPRPSRFVTQLVWLAASAAGGAVAREAGPSVTARGLITENFYAAGGPVLFLALLFGLGAVTVHGYRGYAGRRPAPSPSAE